ncbi:MAG TPA: TIGR00730 family Rossman fold protein [Thermoanaerobaculia bacterium]|nr:TIGR00730 family Rossman fold protein [Thermoanaerobaculia bacterium]
MKAPRRSLRSVCVFCGANEGSDPAYAEAARDLAAALASAGVRLVTGGGRVGLMGVVADAALAAGGEVVGVIPQALLAREMGHTGLTRLEVVETMHERKARMADLSDGFVALPGGVGTLEELFEVWTWAQLGVHEKPCGLVNVRGYYDPLLAFLDHSASEGFLRDRTRKMLIVETDPRRMLERLSAYEPPEVRRWVEPAAT